jgi:hypothetical protein
MSDSLFSIASATGPLALMPVLAKLSSSSNAAWALRSFLQAAPPCQVPA